MKIRFLKGTTVAGGVCVNPGEIHDVSTEDAHRFVKIYRDAEFVVDAPKVVEEPAKAGTPNAEVADAPVEAPEKESKKGKTK